MVSPMPGNTPPIIAGADSSQNDHEVIQRFLNANGIGSSNGGAAEHEADDDDEEVTIGGPTSTAMHRKYDALQSHVQTLQATITLIMDKLQQFELKHRADLSAMK